MAPWYGTDRYGDAGECIPPPGGITRWGCEAEGSGAGVRGIELCPAVEGVEMSAGEARWYGLRADMGG